MLVSVGQFRPEKEQPLQIRALSKVIEHGKNARLVLIGSCRGEEDENRVEKLKKLVQE